MVIFLWIVTATLAALGIAFRASYRKSRKTGEFWFIWVIVACLMAFTLLFVTIDMCDSLYRISNIIPQKIEYLRENNAEIEARMAETIENWQAHEKETYAEFKPGDDVMASIPPTLKSDTLVQSLLETYVANNNDIRYWELQLTERAGYAFWLYFGK